MIFLKIIGSLLIAIGILIPLVQFQAMIESAHVGMAVPFAEALLHPFTSSIMAWAMPLNIASPVLLVAGCALVLKQRKVKPVGPASRPAGFRANPPVGPRSGSPARVPPPQSAVLRGNIAIRRATADDWDALWPIFHAVVSRGETYCYDPDTNREEAVRLWMVRPATAYIAQDSEGVVGTYMLRPNQPCLGAHVANAAFMVAPEASGKGVGSAMGLHALEEARRLGYTAIQFNLVVRPDTAVVSLWESLGFAVIGTVPQAFRHRTLGLTDVHIMHRLL